HPHLIPTVSYSGGKDSLATLLIVMKAIGKIPVIFADSGFEFPETYENIRQVQDRYGVEVVTADNGGTFWKVFQEQGPPAMNARWCCSVCKLHPVNETIREVWGECLSFIGQRRYESFRRMTSAKIWRNPKVPCQLASAPIQQWTALHVWLYLLREEAPYNLLYEKGFDRVGCYICPSSDLATMKMIEEMSPDLWSTWVNRLREWGRNNGHSETWVASGGWRRRGGSG
ncbi:MAG: phosphoadenosine phosphosulfate reductase family protein, partial [Methanomicrobiales archaeon]|nr:phosphoadenosine phosphosulfate reductase family protein [Methanomicrobiales archaeon]